MGYLQCEIKAFLSLTAGFMKFETSPVREFEYGDMRTDMHITSLIEISKGALLIEMRMGAFSQECTCLHIWERAHKF